MAETNCTLNEIKSYKEIPSRESFEQTILKKAMEMQTEEGIDKNIALKNVLWFMASPNFTLIMFNSIKKVLLERKLISEFMFNTEIQKLKELQKNFLEDLGEVDEQEHFDFNSLYSEEPHILIKNEMEKIEKFLSIAGLTDEIVKKASIYCPQLLEKAESMRNKVDELYKKFGNSLKNEKTFHYLRMTASMPFFLTWCEIIMVINGKVNIDIGLVQDRIKLGSSEKQDGD